MKYALVPRAPRKKKSPALSTYRPVKSQMRRAAMVNFQNDLQEAHRNANRKLQLMQVNSMPYDRLSPGMRNSLMYRKGVLEREVANSLLP